MIDIPIGKAMVAVEVSVPPEVRECEGCMLAGKCTGQFGCTNDERKDGKDVIFKLVDWPGEAKVKKTESAVMVCDCGGKCERRNVLLGHND